MNVFYFLLIGVCAGWLAGQLMKRPNGSLVRDLVVGVIGSILGGFAFGLLQIQAAGLLGELITATVGAMLLLFLLDQLNRRT